MLCGEPNERIVDGATADAILRQGSYQELGMVGRKSNDGTESLSDERRGVVQAQARIAWQACQNRICFEGSVRSQAECASGELTLHLNVRQMGGL